MNCQLKYLIYDYMHTDEKKETVLNALVTQTYIHTD